MYFHKFIQLRIELDYWDGWKNQVHFDSEICLEMSISHVSWCFITASRGLISLKKYVIFYHLCLNFMIRTHWEILDNKSKTNNNGISCSCWHELIFHFVAKYCYVYFDETELCASYPVPHCNQLPTLPHTIYLSAAILQIHRSPVNGHDSRFGIVIGALHDTLWYWENNCTYCAFTLTQKQFEAQKAHTTKIFRIVWIWKRVPLTRKISLCIIDVGWTLSTTNLHWSGFHQSEVRNS